MYESIEAIVMGKLSIKVVLAGRNYPLTINEDEEEKVRGAVEMINTGIKKLQENYAVKDMQDLLAMTALQLATRESGSMSNTTASPVAEDMKEVLVSLQHLSEKIDAE